ncbi:peptidoglycan-binding protein [Kitasatospora sp. NPDC101801]|uniref:peptidoglycan-binding domain-containing protein n=1 Tax=Kitasatospora sp. NPDC101801 TaxID=3364103 RepID=UPI0037FD96BE
MSGARCPVCGTVGGADGCPSCAPSDDTTVLPALDTPELVRPYVGAPAPADPFATQVVPAPNDAFATRLMPPVPPAPPAGPPVGPPVAPPQTPPSLQLIPTPPQWTPEPAPTQDLGVFGFRPDPGEPAPGGRAERRLSRQVSAGRRRTVVIAAGVGVAAIGAGLALVLTPGDTKVNHDQALPVPVGSHQPTVSPPAVAAVESPSPSDTPTPSASRSSAKPKPSPSATPTPTPSPSPTPTPTPSATPTPPAPVPTGPRTLTLKMQGADVKDMQSRIADVLWWKYGSSLATGDFDPKTEKAVRDFQAYYGPSRLDDPPGVYGPATRQALESVTD